jgi:hypothetical protein
MSYLSDIATYLANNGIGTLSTDVFYAYLPADIEAGVGVIDTGGPEPDPDIPTKNPTFQVIVRALSYELGAAKLAAIRALLHQYQGTIGSYYFYHILAISEGGHIGKGPSGKEEFSINFKTLMR